MSLISAKPRPLWCYLPVRMSPLTGVKIRSIEIPLSSSQFTSTQAQTFIYAGPSPLSSSLGHHPLPPNLQPPVSSSPFVVFSLHLFSGMLLKHILSLHCSKPVSGYSLSLEKKKNLHCVTCKVCRDLTPGPSSITSLC